METVFDKSKFRNITRKNVVSTIKVNNYLYILDEINSIRMYLIIGENKALLFDTGYGFTDFRPLIAEITDLPLVVVCSHGHDDHIFGNDLFEEVYISEADFDLAMSYDKPEAKDKLIRSRYQKNPNIEEVIDREAYLKRSISDCRYRFIREKDIFDLGGLHLTVYELPGHTKGSIGLFCEETGDFFSGDVLMRNHNFMYGHGIEWSAPPYEYVRALSKINRLTIARIWPAHGDVPAPRQLISQAKEMFADWAMHGDPERDLEKEGTIFGRACIYTYKDLVLAYNARHLEEMKNYMKTHNGEIE